MFGTPTFNLQEEVPYYERASYTWSQDSIRYINTVTPHTRDNYLYVQECGHFKTTFPYYTERSYLPSYLTLYTLSGTGILTYNHQKYELLPQSCFYINCVNPHRYETPSGKNWEFLWLHFYGINAAGYYEDFSVSHMPVLQVYNSFVIENSLQRILSVHQKKTVYAEIITANLITNIITELFIQIQRGTNHHSFLPDFINDTVSYIQSQYAEALSLDIIANKMSISKFHLSREFTRYMGTSINQYIISCRITHAKELLRESSLSVEEIAHNIGLNYTSHFIQLFKKREGVTPLEYRKLWE